MEYFHFAYPWKDWPDQGNDFNGKSNSLPPMFLIVTRGLRYIPCIVTSGFKCQIWQNVIDQCRIQDFIWGEGG